MNTVGVMAGAGIGRALAEWLRDRARPPGFAEFDVARIAGFQSGRAYLRDRTVEAVGVLYELGFLNREYQSARGARRSPLHDRHIAAGAIMGARAGWEVPLVYAPPGANPEIGLSYGRQNWVPWAAAEARTAESGVALFDLSAMAKLRICGGEVSAHLDVLAANRAKTHGAGSALWLTPSGRIESRVMTIRLSDGSVLILSAPGAEHRHTAWIEARNGGGRDVAVTEVTSAFATLLLVGARAEALLLEAGGRYGAIGYAPATIAPTTILDIPSWLVITSSEFAMHALEALERAHAGLPLGGAYALEALRIAARKPAWPQDLDDTISLFEAGLAAEIAWEKPHFVGRDALFEARAKGPPRMRLAHIVLEEDRLALYGQEGILRDGKPVGLLTSGAWNHRVGAPNGFGYMTGADGRRPGGAIELDIAGERMPARASFVGESERE
jgi:4-methylaminobutanoate oxidase (formaldehyde-forming)